MAYYASLGVRIERVITDNGTGYKYTFMAACDVLGIRHIKTRPYTPKTNGKAERFVQTSLREWAYARPYISSVQRDAALQPLLRGPWTDPTGGFRATSSLPRMSLMGRFRVRRVPIRMPET